MAFKRRRMKNGKSVRDAKYSIEFIDAYGNTRRLSAFTDKVASEGLENNIKRIVQLHQSGSELDIRAITFLASCPPRIISKLGEWGVIDSERFAASKTISVHIQDWKESMKHRDLTEKHIWEMVNYVKTLTEWCKWNFIRNMNDDGASEFLSDLRKNKGRSIQTSNHCLVAIKAFGAWLEKKRRIIRNPFADMSQLNARVDKRYWRRPLKPHEIVKVMESAESGIKVNGLTGKERSLLYGLALGTGFRWSELYSLQKDDFDLTDSYTVTVRAENSKNGTEAIRFLPPELVPLFKAHLEPLEADQRAFPNMWKGKGAAMLSKDLESAGIDRKNRSGVIDFHSFRTTIASIMNADGIPLVTIQHFMRHSDPRYTANFYTRTDLKELASSVKLFRKFDDATR